MKTFGEYLNDYVRRAGITDTELARATGVSRQTVFRWREGTTGRPKNRDDLIKISEKLRLAPEEQDQLLLSAGFRPETIPTPITGANRPDPAFSSGTAPAPPDPISRPDTAPPVRPDKWKFFRSRRFLVILIIVLIWIAFLVALDTLQNINSFH